MNCIFLKKIRMYYLQNDQLKISIKHKGAELCSIKSLESNREFVWQANENIWGSHAPNLFPIIGSMKEDSYYYNSELLKMPKHGFARHNDNFEVEEQSENRIYFTLKSNDELRSYFPFEFEFSITYELKDNILFLHHSVKNLDSKTMYFSLGGHPAFNCPLGDNESYTDYVLEFEKPEISESYLLNMTNGLVTNKTKLVFSNGNEIELQPDLFNEDALIFKDLSSRMVALKHKEKGTVLTVSFDGFPFLGIWAKPNAPYVCIEPWIGIADAEDTNQQLTDKEGIVSLKATDEFKATYSIEIDHSQLL